MRDLTQGLPRPEAYAPPADDGLHIAYQDEHLLVIDKPAGLLSVPGRGEALTDCALHRVQKRFPSALLVHRLDEATSGLLMFALHSEAQKAASWAFESREVKKVYTALVHGLVTLDQGVIDAPIAKDWPQRPMHKIDQTIGKAAITHWKLLSKNAHSAQSLLALEPETGRTHQLRVHLQHIKHPIVGDTLYGPNERAHTRLMLHASEMKIQHPMLPSQQLHFISEAPF